MQRRDYLAGVAGVGMVSLSAADSVHPAADTALEAWGGETWGAGVWAARSSFQ